MRRFITTPWKLRRLGLLGMNERNIRLISQKNERQYYQFADNKLKTKERAAEAGIPTPELYRRIRFIGELQHLEEILEPYTEFVIKPCRGAGGNGVVVISEKNGTELRTISGEVMTFDELRKHTAKILHGLFSLGGKPDEALVEYRVNFSRVLEEVSYRGVPDFRVIVYEGNPVMAMGRFPTSHSGGRANLHQGAVGVGIDVTTGVTHGGVLNNRRADTHPDTGASLSGVRIPHWQEICGIAGRCAELTKLGYLGADLVLDEELGPLLLEINVRPGLAIQIANGRGLIPRLADFGYKS